MVKKKASKQLPVSNEQAVELQEPEPVPVVEEYTKGAWAGHDHYQCNLCPFDVLDDEDQMLGHIQMKHRPHSAPRHVPSVLVADKRGNDVTDQVAEDGELNNLFEVELKEVNSTTDEQGNEHKTYTIKE